MIKRKSKRLFAALEPIAAAAALLLGPGLAAQAQTQFYGYMGVVSSSPNNQFPIDTFQAGLELRPDALWVGSGGEGVFSVNPGATLQAAGLLIGLGGNGQGTVTVGGFSIVSETPGRVNLTGTGGRLSVGEWGSGTLLVRQGAVVDAALPLLDCLAASCRTFIGNGAGSSGTLTITDAGSEVRTVRSFTVGQTSVFTDALSGFNFGTPGGRTDAFVNVLNGGTLRTEGATVASNNRSPDGNGSELANGTVVVDGAGSQWIVKGNTIDNTAALMGIGSGAGANGLVTVSGGGKLQIDGAGSPGPNDGINIGSNGKGKLVVTGTGSQLLTGGTNHFINVGANNSLGDGTFEVLAGATASTLYLNVGRNGGTATMLIDGAGTTLTQSGVGVNQSPGANGAAGASIGRNIGGGGGTGSVTVSNCAQWLISDGGGDGRTAQNSPAITLGRGANSSGSLTITGAGSRVQIDATSLGLAPGVADNYNPFFAVGYDNPSTTSGTLTISEGGKLVMNGNAVSTVANPRSTQLNIGGRSGSAGTGTATVTGAGSEILMTGYDAFINVGRDAGSSGVLNVLDGATVTTTSLVVGIGANGTVNIDNATVALVGDRSSVNPPIGAGATIGRGTGGVGALNMSNGATFTITPGVHPGGMSIGGDQFVSGGSGTVTMSGGSSIVINGGSGMNIGRSGTGTATLSNSTITNAGGNIFVAREVGSTGTLALTNGSVINAEFVGVGVSAAGTGAAIGTPGGVGTLALDGDSTVNTGRFELGANSFLVGNGTIDAVGDVVIAGTVSPGYSPGRLRIRCNVVLLPGSRIVLEISGSGSDFGGYEIDQLIIGDTASFDLGSAEIVFSFLGDTNPNVVSGLGGLNLDYYLRTGTEDPSEPLDAPTRALSTLFAPGQGWADVIDTASVTAVSDRFDVTSFSYSGNGTFELTAVPVPEPSTWGLMFAGLAAVGGGARRRKAQAAQA